MATVLTVAFLFSCNYKEDKKKVSSLISSPPLEKKEIEITFVGEVRTRRTFADIQFISDEKEQDKYLAKQQKSNPTLDGCCYTVIDSLLIEQFKRLGLINKDEFIEAKFKPQTKPTTVFADSAKQVYPIHFYYDILTGSTHFKIFFSKDSIDVDTKATPLQDLDYAFLDVIPGGNKELVFLDDYYIMNGYNFDLKVYEIKSN